MTMRCSHLWHRIQFCIHCDRPQNNTKPRSATQSELACGSQKKSNDSDNITRLVNNDTAIKQQQTTRQLKQTTKTIAARTCGARKDRHWAWITARKRLRLKTLFIMPKYPCLVGIVHNIIIALPFDGHTINIRSSFPAGSVWIHSWNASSCIASHRAESKNTGECYAYLVIAEGCGCGFGRDPRMLVYWLLMSMLLIILWNVA